jgi:hypothetical protein
MAGLGKERLPYQITPGGLLAVITAFTVSLCLFCYGGECFVGPIKRTMAMEVPEPAGWGSWWAIVVAASFMGGALGAAIGQVFRDERGGTASMGAFVGALAGPPIVLILFLALLVVLWMWLGGPSV